MSHAHPDPVPRGALLLCGALVVSAVLATSVARLSGAPAAARPDAARAAVNAHAVTSRHLRFIDRADGALDVVEAESGRLVAREAPGSNSGFIRGVMRGMARERHLRGLGPRDPFVLTLWDNGQLTLIDPATTRAVELSAFGDANRLAFLALLPNGGKA